MCTEEDNTPSDVAVIVKPNSDSPVFLNSGEHALYSISLTTSHSYVDNLKITSFDPESGMATCLELPCDSKYVSHDFIYTAPEFRRDSTEVTLTFEATDNEGNSAKVKRYVIVVNNGISMDEKTGIILYAPGMNRPDALSLSDVSNPFSLADTPTPEDADIYMELTDNNEKINWRSKTRTKFVRYNSFKYSNATANSISSVYTNSIQTDFVSDILINDIIIVGHGRDAAGVFQVVNIIRKQDSNEVDCIRLNYKEIIRSENNDDNSPVIPEDPK